MKNSKIHEGLPNKEIRDFLSLSIVKSYDIRHNVKKPDISTSLHGIDWSIAKIERDINLLQVELIHLNELKAIQLIIKQQGWTEYDVSDETLKDLNYNLHMNFIGTEEEYNNLIQKVCIKLY